MSGAVEAIITAHVAAATAGLHRKIAALQGAIEDIVAAHGDLRDRHERMFRPGIVTDYDPVKHLYRQQIGIDEKGNPIKSPWRPYSQHAGALKQHIPLAIGQPMLLISPDGDVEQAIGIPLGWSTSNPSPSTDGATLAGSFGGVSWSLSGGVLTLTGGLTVAGDFKASGGVFTHNSKNVGSDHAHSGVQAGSGDTGAPV
jgi:phage baseplate assembly protein gpV